MRKKVIIVRRTQSGFFGVTIESNYQTAIFRDESEKVKFMEYLFASAKKYGGFIVDYVLEDTHIHLLVYTNQLSKMIGYALKVFSQWYNKRHQRGGKIFVSPFESFEIHNDKQLIEYSYYIMYNTIAAGQCTNPRDYKDCSWRYHFRDGNKEINTSPVDSLFKNFEEYERGFMQYCFVRDHYAKKRGENGRWKDAFSNNPAGDPPADLGNGYHKSGLIRNTDSQVLCYLSEILEGRDVYSLSSKEADAFAKRLYKETYASCRQVATALAMPQDHARYLFRELLKEGWRRNLH